MPSADSTPPASVSRALAGLTCDIYRRHTSPNEEISDDLLRRAFVTSVNGTVRQWRAFLKLLRLIDVAR